MGESKGSGVFGHDSQRSVKVLKALWDFRKLQNCKWAIWDKKYAVMITGWQQQTHAHLTLILQHFLQSPWGGENIDYIRQSQHGEECELKLQGLMVWNVRAKEEYCFPTEVERKFVPLQAEEKQHKTGVRDSC